jgi:MFS family permease
MPDLPPSHPDHSGPFAALRNRDFRLFWSGFFVSNVGTWMQSTAINWMLYELTDSPFQLGLNGIFRAVPVIALGVFAGTIVDRCDRKRVLLGTQIALMAVAFTFALLSQTGVIQVWHIYALTFLTGLIATLDGPARQSLFPSLVPRAFLPNAIALNSLLWKGSILIGPALGGVALATVGTTGTFYANAASFLAVIVSLLGIRSRGSVARKSDDFIEDLREGFTFVIAKRVILGVMVMEAVSSVFGLDHAMLTIFARDLLHAGASGLGFLQSARGLGAILGSSLLIALNQPRAQGKILFFSAVLYGIGFALFGLSHSFALSLLLLVFVGATDTVWGATRNTIMQINAPDAMRGRVMGVFQLSNRGLHPLGQVETGIVVPLIGAREATFFGGLLVTAVTLLTVWKVPGIFSFRWDGSIAGGEKRSAAAAGEKEESFST